MSQRWRGCLLEAAETLVLTLVIYLVMITWVFQPFRIDQTSMERTLEPDQMVFIDKLTPHFSDYKRGDVIVFMPPTECQEEGEKAGEPFIKRVIAVSGETVELRDGQVWVDGQKLDEPYVYDGQPTLPRSPTTRWYVGTDQLFVMGDHRLNSLDSRTCGPIEKSSVIGRVLFRYWPLNKFGLLPTRQGPIPAASPAGP